MSETDRLLENARAYAAGFDQGELGAAPTKRVAVLACMDARLIPSRILGLNEGEAHVIRNAGGVVDDDAIRSLAISQHLLGTEEIILIHHTNCGMATFTDEEFARKLEREAGERPAWTARSFTDVEEDLRDSIARLQRSPFIRHRESIRGFIYDVETGRLTELT
jgi:carbonic anhydrase